MSENKVQFVKNNSLKSNPYSEVSLKSQLGGSTSKKARASHRSSLVVRKESKEETQQLSLMFGMDEFTSLAQAVHERDRNKVEALLSQGEDPNIPLSTGLFRGCIQKDFKILS